MVEGRPQGTVTTRPKTRKASSRPRRSSGWWVVRVTMLSERGEELVDPPGRDLLMSRTHTFADLAKAIDRAFARWDLSHLHEFRLPDGRRVVMADEADDPEEIDPARDLDERGHPPTPPGPRPGDRG